MKNKRSIRTSEIQASKREIKQIWKSIRNSNRKCMVPTLPGETAASDVLTDCHIIGEPCLEVIARDSHIYEWPYDPTLLWNSALSEAKAGNVTSLPGDIGSAIPFKSRGNSIGKCVWKFACNYHDNKVFKRIETPDMDLTSTAVQFLLGFRTIAATTAWAQSHLRFGDTVFLNRKRTRRTLREYPQTRAALPQFEQQVSRLKIGVARLEREIGRWQDTYSAQPDTDYPILTCHRTVRPAIRSAGAGVSEWCGSRAIVATILPRRQDGQSKALCSIVVTCLRPRFWLMGLFLRWRIYQVARRIERLVSTDPLANLPVLVSNLEFFYVSPEDFDNDSILDADQRRQIHERISRERQAMSAP